MEQNLNDKTACLVTAFQSGDVSAFSTLYDMHINLLFNYGQLQIIPPHFLEKQVM